MKQALLMICMLAAGMGINSCAGKKQNATDQKNPLNGTWLLTLDSRDVGKARTYFYFTVHDSEIDVHTRPGADRLVLGFFKSKLARMFSSSLSKGMLMHLVKGHWQAKDGGTSLSGVIVSMMGNYYFNAEVKGDSLSGSFRDGKQRITAYIKGHKTNMDAPLMDYVQLAKAAISTAEQELYNPNLLQAAQWKDFKSTLTEIAPKVHDDLEITFSFFYLAGKLPFSHFALTRNGDAQFGGQDTKNVALDEINKETSLLKIFSFGGSGAEIDSVFNIIQSRGYKNLIVDLRENAGGGIEAGMRFAQHIAAAEQYGGVFLTRKWFNTHTQPPAVSEYEKLETFTDNNYELLIQGIHSKEALCLKMKPDAPVYLGKVYILVSQATASTCEPLIYAFKKSGRAVLIGSTSAGAMLNGESFPLAESFQLFLPTADYYAADGYHIDGKGVEPDIKTKPAEALEEAKKQAALKH